MTVHHRSISIVWTDHCNFLAAAFFWNLTAPLFFFALAQQLLILLEFTEKPKPAATATFVFIFLPSSVLRGSTYLPLAAHKGKGALLESIRSYLI